MRQLKSLWCCVLALSPCGISLFAQVVPLPPLPIDRIEPQPVIPATDVRAEMADGIEIQTRGPIHEAFAEIFQANPQPGLLITQRPPKAIDEAPPSTKLDGKEVIWIPGYWSWDDENRDFLWVSGIWRNPPPGHEWAPGYWAEVEGGFRWVSGFWAEKGEKIVIRPSPPAAQDETESLESAPEDQFWVPGNWQWQTDQYVWRQGYYAPCQTNWVWVPARWKWTPSGCIHLAGYWDYRPTVRAMLFAPVRIQPHVLLRPGFVLTPRVVVDPWIAINHFWVRPSYCHYYFGNYYAGQYAQWDFHPYASHFHAAGNWDPLLCYYQGLYRRQGIDFHAQLDARSSFFAANAEKRPPLSWNLQQRIPMEERENNRMSDSIITKPLDEFVASAQSRVPLVTIQDNVRLALGKADSRVSQQILAHRQIAEQGKVDAAATGKVSDLVNWSLPKVDRLRNAKTLGLAEKRTEPQTKLTPQGLELGNKGTRTSGADQASRTTQNKAPISSSEVNTPNEQDARKAAMKAEMDVLRGRFGNDPVRFQQEVDRLMSRRAGEPPATSSRHRSPPMEQDPQPSLQGSGRTGGLGSPDFRLLPRSSGGGSQKPKR